MSLAEWGRAAAVYLDRRVLGVAGLGFSSGLPLLLTFSTLSVWLAELEVSLTTIGLFALVGLPYSTKFAWAPLIDRLPLPWLTRRLGRRRGWALATQGLLAIAILALGHSDPAATPAATAAWAVLVAFASASQDVVIDAYRVEILQRRQYGAGAAVIVAGYRIGMLAAGAGALFLAEWLTWPAVYAVMAALVGVGIATVLAMPEPGGGAPAPQRPDLLLWLRQAVLEPFLDFLQRTDWPLILAFILLYKLGDSLAGTMANPFYIKIGFSKAEIASVSKLFGLLATLAGGFLGGLLVARIGVWKSLLWAGVLQMASNLMFAVQAAAGDDLGLLTLTIAAENLSGGMGTAAFVAYLSSLCNVAYTATQYALLSSLMAVPRTMLSSGSGALAEESGWIGFFLLTTLAAVPGLLLLFGLRRGIAAADKGS